MARMLCVLGMIFVHVPDGQTASPIYAFNAGGLGFFLEGLLVEGPGRASAALLSVVSGYLAAFALLRANGAVLSLYRRRFISIVLPMVFWGAVTYLVYLLVAQTRPTFVSEATSLMDNLNIVFFITEMPIGATMHLGFLRDLFVCILFAPVLISAVQRMPWVLLSLLGLFYLFEHEQSAVIILRPLVLFAFTIGLTLAVRNVRLDSWDRFCPLFIVLAVFSTATIMLVNGGAGANLVDAFSAEGLSFSEVVLYPLGRLSGSLAIWTFLPVLVGGSFQRWALRNSPYVFATFCSHYLMLTVLFFAGWQPVFGDRGSDMFFVWFLAAPLVSMAIAIAIVQCALKIAPPLATLITGGRMSPTVVGHSPAMARRRSEVFSN
jgi:succinoglycan biosynthesis protein ExoH